MQLLHDLLPLLIFFGVFKAQGIFAATAALIVAVLVQTGVQWARGKEVSRMALGSAAAVAVLGGATLAMGDSTFLQWKPTVVYWLLGGACLGSLVVGERPLIERLLGAKVRLPRPAWVRLNLAWAAFFLALGGLNLLVAYRFDLDTWATFKVFGLLGLTVAFLLAQAPWLSRHMIDDEPAEAEGV
ncbi:MAG: septation protein A [Planctomycetota bacterium]|nr:septation protein A [Planctomycetota bacterium]